VAPGTSSTISHVHNQACETAALANCHCFCHGAGHQNDLVVRAASCDNVADMTSLLDDLERVLGGFHTSFRDTTTRTRPARNVLTPTEAASLGHLVGRGATWYETLLVDEALHASFVDVANSSLSSTASARAAAKVFVDSITRAAIPVVGSRVTLTNVVESHVWCSIVAEHLALLSPPSAAEPLPRSYADICYPRKSTGRIPGSFAGVRAAGLAHLAAASGAATSLPTAQKLALIRLVGAAACPDLWHHPAAVRFCIRPLVTSSSWPPARTTAIVTPLQLGDLSRRWQRKGHW
jgi:hypothetical protein